MKLPEEFYMVFFDIGDGDGAMQFETTMLRTKQDVRDHLMEIFSDWPDAECKVFLVEEHRLVDVTDVYETYRTTIVSSLGITHRRKWIDADA